MRLSNLLSGEKIGALAVVLSLVFVGIEVRDGNREARASTTQAALDAEMAFQATLAQHAEVWQQVVIDGDFSDEVAVRRAIVLFNMAMTLYDNRFQMANSGYVDFSGAGEGLRRTVIMPFYDTWRPSSGAAGRSPAFLEYVDDMRHREITQ